DDRAGLVLPGRPRRCPRADHRPDLFRPDRRLRPLALPPGAQARRPPARWLALRLPPSPPEIRQSVALQALRFRAARHHPPPAAAGLYAVSGGRDRRADAARFRAGSALWKTCER